MNRRRYSTTSPISFEKSISASAASSIETCCSVRVSGSIVVSRNCSAFISPRPLNRLRPTPGCLRTTSSTAWRSASNDSASSVLSPSVTVNGGTPADSTSAACTRRKLRYSGASKSSRRIRFVRALDLLVEQRGLLEERDHLVAVLGAQGARPALVLLAQARVLLPPRLGELERLVVAVEDLDAVELVREEHILELGLLLDVALAAALLELVERRLGDVDVARLDQVLHLAEQQREDEGADVCADHVGVRHQDHLVVASALEVELVADAGADRGDERLDLLVAQHLVDARALDVEDLAAQRQHRLRVPVAPLLRRAAGGVALDDEDLAQRRVLDRAVGELAGQARVLERALAAGGGAGPCARRP